MNDITGSQPDVVCQTKIHTCLIATATQNALLQISMLIPDFLSNATSVNIFMVPKFKEQPITVNEENAGSFNYYHCV